MFIQEDLLNQNLLCNMCNKRFQDPVILPCAETVCNICINDYIEEHSSENNGQFKCCMCDEEHLIPAKGFPKSKLANQMLALKAKQVHKGVLVEQFKKDINQCINEVNKIKSSLETKEDIVKDYFEAKRQQVYQVTESKINELNKRSRELLDRIDELESEYLENLKNKQPPKEIENDLNKTAEFCAKWIEKFKIPETKEEDAKKERNELDDHLKSVQQNSNNLNDYIFNSQQLDFIENQDEIKSLILGELVFGAIKDDRLSAKKLDNVSTNLKLANNLLIDLNQFSDGELCATYVENLNYYKRNEMSDKHFVYTFSLLDSSETIFKSFTSSKEFYVPFLDNRYVRSTSNGTHVLISIFYPIFRLKFLYIISNSSPSKYETSISTSKEYKISIDSKQVYVMNSTNKSIDIYNLALQFVRSIQVNQDQFFMPTVLFKVSDDFLYVFNCENHKIDIIKLSDMNLIKSKNINIEKTYISKALTNNYLIFGFKDSLRFFNINSEKVYSRSISNINTSDSNFQLRALDENNLLLFNVEKNEYFVLT